MREGSLEALAASGAARLAKAGVADASRDARWLLREAAGLSAAGLSAALRDPADDAVARRFEALIVERCARRPVSHLIGRREFYGRSFKCDGRALDPRPESEALVEAALAHWPADRPARVLDLGVGSGCLLLSVLAERPLAAGLGVDQSAEALALAAENVERFEKDGIALRGRLELRRGDWLTGVEGRFDIVLCNPPYIDEADWRKLEPEVRLHEPKTALTPGEDGLRVYRGLARRLATHLSSGGAGFFEVGRGQAEEVRALFMAEGLCAEIRRDLGGVDRVVAIWRLSPSSAP